MALTEQEMLAELRKYDTPSITNVVATYSGKSPLPWALQPVDRKLVHRYHYPLYVS